MQQTRFLASDEFGNHNCWVVDKPARKHVSGLRSPWTLFGHFRQGY